MLDVNRISRAHIALMQRSLQTVGNLVANLDQELATTLRDPNDGDKGWTILEILCHLRDFDEFYQQRIQMMLTSDYPHLPAYDHEQLAIERQYNEQDLQQVYAALVASRTRFVQLSQGLSDEQWRRAGVHPHRGYFSMLDACMQVGPHDNIHIEQITRILRGRHYVA